MLNPGPVAIIGTGISGLSCAQALRLVGVEVHLFEKADRVGGRCATCLWQGHLVDYGVQYFTAQSLEFKRELLSCLRQFRPIISPILDARENVIHSERGARFYVVQGNNYFTQVLSRGLDIRLEASVEALTIKKEGIECLGQTYQAVIASLPAAHMAHFFDGGQPIPKDDSALSVVLEYNEPNSGDSEDCYGRALQRSEPLASSYCENHKAGRVLNNRTVFVLQAAPEFSRLHAEEPGDKYIPELARVHEELWKIPSGKLTASFAHRWRLPGSAGDSPAKTSLPKGAFVCGDLPSDSTAEDIWLHGRRIAAEVLAHLSS